MDKKGLYIIEEADGRHALFFDGKEIGRTKASKNQFALFVNDKELVFNGASFALSANDSPQLREIKGNLYFGEIPLFLNGECINITMSDYNKLLAGKLVAGYTRFNPSAIYNIVSDVSTSKTMTYTISNGVVTFSDSLAQRKADGMIYNNSILQHNVEDNTATVSNPDSPFLCVRQFSRVIPTGSTINLSYYVDTHNMMMRNYNTIERTFTVEVTTASGTTIKKTTYAGFFDIETPSFGTTGETWFSMRCIDSRGVSSYTQYFDILVKSAVADNPYTMQESDLEEFTYNDNTYQIVTGTVDVETAIANKAALTAFFAKVKAGGYNKVVMLQRDYWIDYHKIGMPSGTVGGDNIVFPNNFTVDLNGASIKLKPCIDLKSNVTMIRLYKNIDTHIINGYIVGNYENYDFASAATAQGVGCPSEGYNVISTTGARFCSFENLDVSNAVGYDGAIAGIYNVSCVQPTFSAGGINISTGEPDSSLSNMVVSNIVTLTGTLLSYGEITIAKFGFAGYWCGRYRDCFLSFYDEGGTYIRTVKSKLYVPAKIPSGAKKVRVSGYGTLQQWAYQGDIGPYVTLHALSKGIEIKSCHWHDTRTCALCPGHADGISWINCSFENIATENRDAYRITRMVADLEDGWQNLRNVLFKDCNVSGSLGVSLFTVNYCTNLDFVENSGFGFSALGGLESGFVEQNTIKDMTVERTGMCFYPNVLYDNNTIRALNVVDNRQVDDPLSITRTVISNRCIYKKLNLKDSVNGDEYVL